jgi:purine-binding chemotaxis protein CheW
MSHAQPADQAAVQGREYLTFRLGDEEYGVDILRVQEIRSYDPVTRIANAPGFIKGVINLRGNIVPIVDMRVRLQLGLATYDPTTVVIILNVDTRTVGVVVDGVSDVVALKPDELRPAPELGGALDTRYVTGLGALADRMLILIDIESLINEDILNIAAAA